MMGWTYMALWRRLHATEAGLDIFESCAATIPHRIVTRRPDQQSERDSQYSQRKPHIIIWCQLLPVPLEPLQHLQIHRSLPHCRADFPAVLHCPPTATLHPWKRIWTDCKRPDVSGPFGVIEEHFESKAALFDAAEGDMAVEDWYNVLEDM